jgi:multicomponent Na+:H+ antiporter subunit B
MRKTDILDVVARKLAPYMFLFGLYLVSFGDVSPGGGFQGGVVIASGIILIAMARGTATAEQLASYRRLVLLETVAFAVFLLAGAVGIALGTGFLSDPTVRAAGDASRFVFLLNIIIGFKVAAGAALICLTLFREE